MVGLGGDGQSRGADDRHADAGAQALEPGGGQHVAGAGGEHVLDGGDLQRKPLEVELVPVPALGNKRGACVVEVHKARFVASGPGPHERFRGRSWVEGSASPGRAVLSAGLEWGESAR
ncbi:hypothetical protein GCM10010306_095850 [Streptomyces umbrinus]|nr:hypothetical protein GCM10010306_095850 [Streptomyces umbrinus]